MGWEGLNRRKFPRANFPCLIKLVQDGVVQESILTHTENISSGGASVVIRKGLELFSTAAVEVDLMGGGDIITCQIRVVWSVRRKAIEEYKPSCYDIGVEFVGLRDDYRIRIEAMVEHLVRTGREAEYR